VNAIHPAFFVPSGLFQFDALAASLKKLVLIDLMERNTFCISFHRRTVVRGRVERELWLVW
jgi:hypothetical protein